MTDQSELQQKDVDIELLGLTGSEGDGVLTIDQREYLNQLQEETALSIHTYLESLKEGDKSPLVAMATGIGKGRIIHKLIEQEFLFNPQSRVLLIAGTKTVLVKQTKGALQAYVESEESEEENNIDLSEEDELEGYSIGSIGSGSKVEVATIQGIQRKKIDKDAYDLVIVDEVHNIGTKKRLDSISQFRRVVGFTATPHRHTGKMKSPEEYGFKIIESLSLPEAQNLELLPPLYAIQVDTSELIDKIPTTVEGKIDFKKLEIQIKIHPELREYIVEQISPLLEEGYKSIISVNFVWEAEELALLLKKKGIKVGIAINQTDSKRLRDRYEEDGLDIATVDSVERYKKQREDNDSIQVLISPYVASEGFDAPATEVMVWASATDSTLRYTQYTGRLARRNAHKAYGIVVDFLYQTEQFGWSKNFAQWFKGDVHELKRGVLYMGPISKVKNIDELKSISSITGRSNKSTEELENTGVLEKVSEDDFVVKGETLSALFIGEWYKLAPISDEVVKQLEEEGLMVTKVNGPRRVSVCTDPGRFIELMLARGVERKINLEEVSEDDFVVKGETLRALFVGDNRKLTPISDEVVRQLEEESLMVTKVNGSRRVSVCRDPERFIELMLARGVERKINLEKVSEDDFVVNQLTLDSIFIGGWRKLAPMSDEVVKQLEEESLMVTKVNGSRRVGVCRDPERFIELMLARGVKRKINLE
jgi:superfamily II DNA or RNA helicase